MGQIQKKFALTIGICGILSLLFSFISTVCGWVFASKIPYNIQFRSFDEYGITSYSFGVYWWGGLALFGPGILGIVVAYTKNFCAMVAFLIFNIIGMLAAIACFIVVALVLVVWTGLGIDDNSCKSVLETCTCTVNYKRSFIINTSCETLSSIQPLLLTISIGVALSVFVAFIASYVSCSSLCNTEQVYPGMVVVQQPSNMVVMANTQFNQVPQAPYYNQQIPYGGLPPAYSSVPVTSYDHNPTHDKAALIDDGVF
ncbi:uncharacterized protein LOC105849133 [Hydra vulgaris]|uniref:uncharacterized protein LOC105849133 n=1 Tax=Hydra vulgaris TaxID=6087 RepID=UPI001F5E684F|nr:uncharacterized protein LOC105849133 [Hydra vulgaris]